MGAPIIVDHAGNPIKSEYLGDYEAATTGARLGQWGLSSTGPNQSVLRGGTELRRRTREAYRNNPYAVSVVDSWVSNLVGSDISPQWLSDNEETTTELQELWEESQQELDFYGQTNFYGQQEQVARSEKIDGEVLARFITPPKSLGLLVPFQIQLLEADFLPLNHDGPAKNKKNYIKYGIEFNAEHRRVAYHLERAHPGEFGNISINPNLERVPADRIAHIFHVGRPGQARGTTGLSSILLALREIDKLTDATLTRKNIAALFSGAIVTQTGMADISKIGGKRTKVAQGSAGAYELGQGLFPKLAPNEDIKFFNLPDEGSEYGAFLQHHLERIAAGAGCTAEMVSKNLENVNYTSIRAGLIEFRRLLKAYQQRTIIFQFCRPAINKWMDAAVLSGAVKSLNPVEYLNNLREWRRVQWNPDGFDFTDPVKDLLSEQMKIRFGLDTRMAVAGRMSNRVEEIDKQNSIDMRRAESLGLKYDVYSLHTNKAGNLASVIDAEIDDAMEEGK